MKSITLLSGKQGGIETSTVSFEMKYAVALWPSNINHQRSMLSWGRIIPNNLLSGPFLIQPYPLSVCLIVSLVIKTGEAERLLLQSVEDKAKSSSVFPEGICQHIENLI